MYNIKELKEKGCAMWDEEILLLTPEVLKEVKNGDVLFDINNTKIIVGVDEKKEDFDYDCRFGCTAYGIKITKEELGIFFPEVKRKMEDDFIVDTINEKISLRRAKEGSIFSANEISDGYHTFGELYKHRTHLYIALCRLMYTTTDCMDQLEYKRPIRAKIHNDGLNVWEEWGKFLLLIQTNQGQISYHIDKEYWDNCDFAEIQEKCKIKFDGHTSDDVLYRLLSEYL